MHTSNTLPALFFLFAGALVVSATPRLELRLSGAAKVDGVTNFKVVATVTNTGDETLKLLNDPRGPLSTLPAETFSLVHESGAMPDFVGIRAKYIPSAAARVGKDDAFTILAPGKSVSIVHDLSSAYDFTLSGSGQYSIEAVDRFHFVDPQTGAPTELIAEQPSAHFTSLSGQLAIPPAATKRETYTKCSAAQETTLVAAAEAAQAYAAGALSYTLAQSASTTRFATWFGKFSTANQKTILTHFTNLNGNNYSSYAFDCSCTDSGVYAYSRPTVFGKVFLCGSFWQAPLTGTDSQGGTLVHESTHFVTNAGTQDYAYGQTDCQSLAQTDPSEAIMNADSHEYYAENNPVLS